MSTSKSINQTVATSPQRPSARQKQTTAIDDEIFLQPWFLPKDVHFQIRRLLPNAQLSKMRYYFDDYGCMKCGARNCLYGSNGMCPRCTVLVRFRIERSLKRRLKAVGVTDSHPVSLIALTGGMDKAQSLLGDIAKAIRRPPPMQRRRRRKLIG